MQRLISSASICLLLAMIMTGCGAGSPSALQQVPDIVGTEVGNPNEIPGGAHPAAAGADGDNFDSGTWHSEAGLLMDVICSKLSTTCYSGLMSMSECRLQFILIDNIDNEIGLTAEAFPNFGEIHNAEESGLLQANLDATQACRNAIENMACSDPTFVAAFDPTSPTDFSRLHSLLPQTVCPGFYMTPPTPPSDSDPVK